ncbi:MAG: LLM class flavin-dependent oxidoreductase [Nitrososphaerota archaeon]|nr:LLM class flavin-dependent oxidoreductase [Nitrososphaerota archaeon]
MAEFKLDLSFYSSTPPDMVSKAASLADDAGFDAIWVGEFYFFRDVISQLGYICAKTKNIRVATGTINIFTRHPALIAMTAATLDHISNGRFTLGIGYGGFPRMPLMGYELFPLEDKKPLKRLMLTVDVIKRLIARERVRHSETFVLSDVALDFEPSRKHIPIYIFSEGSKTISLSPKFADGAVITPGIKDVKTIESRIKLARSSAEKHNPNFDITGVLYTLVTKDSKEAVEKVKKDIYFLFQILEVIPYTTVGKMKTLEEFGISQEKYGKMLDEWKRFNIPGVAAMIPDELVRELMAAGSPDDCLEKIEGLKRIGLTRICINPSASQDLEYLVSVFSPKETMTS